MPSKYYNTISKVKTDENFKNNLVEKLKAEQAKISEEQTKVSGLYLLKMKVRKFFMTVATILGILLGSGAVYAGINQIPFLEIFGITFSKEYVEYIEPVANQVLENDNVRVALESTVCDDGFTVLQFRINLKSEEYINTYSATDDNLLSATCLSFNDPIVEEDGYKYLDLGGANYNVIINGEEIWLRGASANGFEYISESEAIFYQTWFFSEDKFKNKTEFSLTLDEVVLGLGEDVIPLEGKFEVSVSKDRAKQNTKTFDGGNKSFAYKKSTNKIEKVLMTPMQNIVKISKLQKNVNVDDLTYLLDKDYIGLYSYAVYDQDDNFLTSNAIITKEQMTYNDGEIDDSIPGDFMFRDEFDNAEFLVYEYLIVEKNENIKKLRIEVNETNDYYDMTKKVAEFYIDLEKENVKVEEFDEIVEVNDDYKYEEYLQNQIQYINDNKVDEISKGNTDYLFLYEGFEIEKKTGVQYLDYIDINDENNTKYNINYYNYRKNEYTGKTKGIFGVAIGHEGTSWVENVGKIATSKKFDLMPREVIDIYDIPEKLQNKKKNSETMLMKIDLDGDNTFEYIGINIEHINTGLFEEMVQPGVLECTTTVTLYNKNFEKIDTLVTLNDDYRDGVEYLINSNDVQFADIDNDGIIEILVEFSTWDGYGLSIYKYNNGNLEGDVEIVSSIAL